MRSQPENQNSQDCMSDNSDQESFVQNRIAWVLREQIKPTDPCEQSKASDLESQVSKSDDLNDAQDGEDQNQFNHLAPIHELKKKHNNLKFFMFNGRIGGQQMPQQESKEQQQGDQEKNEEVQNEHPNIKKEEIGAMKLQYNQQEVREQSTNQAKKSKRKPKKSQPQVKILEQDSSEQIPGLVKPARFSDLQADLRKPIEQLQKILPKLQESRLIKKQEMKQTKRIENMFDKKMKEYKHGKKNDQLSNQVFNFIEEYFN